MINFLTGAIAMASCAIAFFFLRFWRSSGQRFFLYFALSFFVEAGHRVYSVFDQITHEDSPYHYLIRLLSYSLILWAIIEKNWQNRQKNTSSTLGEDQV
ncbi:DUF5985 family protein [Undibacterium pigrum]|uniref:Uncharacterized protein n=1 Tax=Undibacterium pigrum TaxID=401470 RepID=A0A318JEG3_9BURK|nr:DUF5985 family protein [Undibacterium pigrum]PXX46946.1 hypothetical protein DFR42_101522 [Undibacterium pigrum]